MSYSFVATPSLSTITTSNQPPRKPVRIVSIEISSQVYFIAIAFHHFRPEPPLLGSDASALEDPAVNSDESDTQSAPETPSDLSVMPHPQTRTPTPTPTPANSIPPSSQLICGAADEPNSSSSACGTPTAPSSAINGSSSAPSVTPPSDAGEEKVTPYFHSILRQVADGGSGGEANTTSAQRVTINMRTFKVGRPWSRLEGLFRVPLSRLSDAVQIISTERYGLRM